MIYNFSKTEMLDFSILSLNDLIIPDFPEMPAILQEHQQEREHIDIMNSETIGELFINLYFDENPNITFEEMQQKLIDFYLHEATEDLITRHLDSIHDMIDISVWTNLLFIANHYNYHHNNYDIQLIINFISSLSKGIEYLQEIYNMNRIIIV